MRRKKTDLRLQLGILSGRILDADGKPLADMEIDGFLDTHDAMAIRSHRKTLHDKVITERTAVSDGGHRAQPRQFNIMRRRMEPGVVSFLEFADNWRRINTWTSVPARDIISFTTAGSSTSFQWRRQSWGLLNVLGPAVGNSRVAGRQTHPSAGVGDSVAEVGEMA